MTGGFSLHGIRPVGVGQCAASWMKVELNTSQGVVLLPVGVIVDPYAGYEIWVASTHNLNHYPPPPGQKFVRVTIQGPGFGFKQYFWGDEYFTIDYQCPLFQRYSFGLSAQYDGTPIGIYQEIPTFWLFGITNALCEVWFKLYDPHGGTLADIRQVATYPQTPRLSVPLSLNSMFQISYRAYGGNGLDQWSDWQPWSPPVDVVPEWFCSPSDQPITLVGPYPRQEGFYPNDSANLEVVAQVQQQSLLRLREQVDLLRQLVAQGTNGAGGGGVSEFESRMQDFEGRAGTNSIPGRILAAQSALQSEGSGVLTNALLQPNPFSSAAGIVSSAQMPSVTPVTDDWVVQVAGFSVDLNPTRRLEPFFPIVSVYWWLLFLVFPLLWWWWAFDEARQVFAQVVLKVPDAASASSSLWGAVFKKAGVVLTLVLIALTVAAIGWAASVMINWAFSTVSPSLWSAMGSAGTAVQRVWRMANELFPVQWTMSLLVTTFVGYLTIHGLVVLVITFLHSAGAFVKWAAPVVALLLLPVGWADWRLEVVGPPDRGLILEAMTDRGYYTAAHYPGPSVLMPDAMGTWLVSGAWEDPPMLPLTVNAGDTVRLSIVPYSTNEWVIERFFVRRLQDERELAGVWISTAAVGLGVIAFLWAFKKAIRPLTLRE